MRRLGTFALLLLFPAFIAGGCKKKEPVGPEKPAMGPEIQLQVTSIEPSAVAPNAPVSATVFGSAFENGAAVSFDGPIHAEAADVRFSSTNTLALTIPPLPLGTYDVTVRNPGGVSTVLRGGLSVRPMDLACRSMTVNFDFDSSALTSPARSALDANLACLQQVTGNIRVEGHCDERGTTDYNLVLGQRRAETVRSYLVTSGVGASRIQTTSYGEEKPVDSGHNEAAWAKNRRAEILANQ